MKYPQPKGINDIVSDIEKLCVAGSEEQAMDMLLDAIEPRLRDNDFVWVNKILDAIDPDCVDVGVTLIALTITYSARTRLATRANFFDRAQVALRSKLGVERADRLLAHRN